MGWLIRGANYASYGRLKFMLPGVGTMIAVEAARRVERDCPLLAASVPCLAVALGAYLILAQVLVPNMLGVRALIGAGLVLATVAAFIVRRRFVRRQIDRLLDEPKCCRGCGYPLAGLPSPRCPECGRAMAD